MRYLVEVVGVFRYVSRVCPVDARLEVHERVVEVYVENFLGHRAPFVVHHRGALSEKSRGGIDTAGDAELDPLCISIIAHAYDKLIRDRCRRRQLRTASDPSVIVSYIERVPRRELNRLHASHPTSRVETSRTLTTMHKTPSRDRPLGLHAGMVGRIATRETGGTHHQPWSRLTQPSAVIKNRHP